MSEVAAAITARGLVKTFEDGLIRALAGVDLDVGAGEFVAVEGPSGCGKSTLLHLIAALDRPDAGTIRVNGRDLAAERDLARYRASEVGLVFQLDNLLPALTASENVQVPMLERRVSAKARTEEARRLLALVDLTGREHARPPKLSGGERQRVAIARALANDPPILLADEPPGRLNTEAGRMVLALLAELQRQRSLTVVMVTHDRDVAARANRVVRMVDGRVVGEAAKRVLATLLFTDIVGSTERARRVGDAAWRTLRDRHHEAVRQAVARHDGIEVDTAGDGFFMRFDSPAQAIEAARAARAAVGALDLALRVGIHTGECEVEPGGVAGMAVHIAARIQAAAAPGEILVSGTVRDLAIGSGLRFEDRGEHALKGVGGRWRLHALV
jgi:putative ABC transport system ATP-binding protein